MRRPIISFQLSISVRRSNFIGIGTFKTKLKVIKSYPRVILHFKNIILISNKPANGRAWKTLVEQFNTLSVEVNRLTMNNLQFTSSKQEIIFSHLTRRYIYLIL